MKEKKYKILRKNFYIIETQKEVEVTYEELEESQRIEETDPDYFFNRKWLNNYLEEIEGEDEIGTLVSGDNIETYFKNCSDEAYLGSITILENGYESVLVDTNIKTIIRKNPDEYLLNRETLETFNLDYSSILGTNLKGFLRNEKINGVLNDGI